MGSRVSNEDGMSLIGAVCAMGIVSVLGTAVLTQISSLMTTAQAIESRLEVAELQNEVQLGLSKGEACSLNLRDLNLGGSIPPAGRFIKLTHLRYLDSTGSALSNENITTLNQRLPRGSIVSDLAFRATLQTGPTDFIGRIEMTVQRPGNLGSSLVRGVPVAVQTDAAMKVTSCRLGGAGAAAGTELDSLTCESAFDRLYQVTLPKARLGYKWTDGYSASCACTFVQPLDTQAKWSCEVLGRGDPGGGGF